MRSFLRYLAPLTVAAGAVGAILTAPVAVAQPGTDDGNDTCLNEAPNALGEGTVCPPGESRFGTQPNEIHNQSTFLYPWADPFYGPATVVDWG